jgi:HSP20 family molecular chaperone IbpA
MEEIAGMARVSLFNSPLLLGFEHLERTLDRLSKVDGEGYPPYNIEQTGPNGMRISLAVAGFGADDLALTVEENQLIVRGRQGEDNDRVYLHRGIAARQFQRTFLLAEGIEIEGADLEDGLLHIILVRPEPKATSRTIEIRKGGSRTKTTAIEVD